MKDPQLENSTAFMEETTNAVQTLMEAFRKMREGRQPPGDDLESPRQASFQDNLSL
jgi:hypothetical protein